MSNPILHYLFRVLGYAVIILIVILVILAYFNVQTVVIDGEKLTYDGLGRELSLMPGWLRTVTMGMIGPDWPGVMWTIVDAIVVFISVGLCTIMFRLGRNSDNQNK